MLGPKVGYTDLLDYAIKEKIENDAKENKYHPLRPSSAGYCARKLAYSLTEYRGLAKYEKPLKSPEVYRLLDLGHAVEFSTLRHFQLLKVFQQRYKQQVLTFFELPREDMKKELVEGSCDFVLWSEKYKAVGDVKSKKDGWSQAYKSRWEEELEKFSTFGSLIQISETAFYADNLQAFLEELGDDFLTDNLHQLNLYATSEFLRQRGVDHAFLYRYNKNDSRHMEIRFRPCLEAAKYVQEKFSTVNKLVDAGTPEAVNREYMLGSMQCAFCDYKNVCWPDDNALKEYFNTMPKKKWPTDIQEGSPLFAMFTHFEKAQAVNVTLGILEKKLVKAMEEAGLKKVKLPNGHIYEMKYLKSPHPHVELRRGKL